MARRVFAMMSIDTKFVMHCTRGFSSLSLLSKASRGGSSEESCDPAMLESYIFTHVLDRER